MNETPLASGPPSYDERFDALAALSYQVAYRMVGSREDARDIAQEALARAYARWPKVRDKAGGWVAKVTTNLALDLPGRQRDAVVLRYLADLSEADVAAALGCSVGAVKQHTRRGLAALRTSLDLS